MKMCTKCKTKKSSNEFYKCSSSPDGLQYICKDCKRRYNEEHRNERAQYVREYNDEHRDTLKKHRMKYRAATRDKERSYKRIYRKIRRKEINAYNRSYYAKHCDDRRDKIREKNFKRRVMRRLAPGDFVSSDVPKIFKRQSGKCFYCGVILDSKKYDIDHVIPLSRGGTNNIENVVIACTHCNRSKGNKLLNEWTEYFHINSKFGIRLEPPHAAGMESSASNGELAQVDTAPNTDTTCG